MRLIKAVLIGGVSLFVVMTLLSLLIPSTVKVSRTTLINNTTVAKVYNQVAVLENWKNWHPVFKSGSTEIKLAPSSSTQDHQSGEISYNGKQVGVTILSTDSNSIKFLLESPGETAIRNEISVTRVPGQNNVQVSWNAFNKLKWYPWEKFYAIFIDKLTGPGYEEGLKGLKDYLESN